MSIQAPEVSAETLVYRYIDRVIEKVKEMLGDLADLVDDVWVDVRAGKAAVDVTVTIKMDVTDITPRLAPCIYISDIHDMCAEQAESLIERGELKEEEFEDYVERCIDYEIEQFRDEEGGAIMGFGWTDLVNYVAYMKTEEVDWGDKLCIHDYLYLKWRFTVYRDAAFDIARSDAAAEHDAKNLAHVIKKLVDAVKTLSQ
jgi:hypothetical protein